MTVRTAPRWAFARVVFGTGPAGDFDTPYPRTDIFSRSERLRSAVGNTSQHWAGRLAAKRSVLHLLDLDETAELLRAVEIVPRAPRTCRRSVECRHGHPPVALLAGEPLRRADELGVSAPRVSISHAGGVAVAVAIATRSTLNADRCGGSS